MREESPSTQRPSTDPDAVTFVSRVDGTAVTVSSQPGIAPNPRVIMVRIQSPLLDVLNAVYLNPDEAHQLAAVLSTAAFCATAATAAGPSTPRQRPAGGPSAARRRTDPATAAAEGDPPPGAAPTSTYSPGRGDGAGDGAGLDADQDLGGRSMTSRCAAATLMHSVTAGEGATAADLRGALAIVPPFAELVDFSTDTDVVLVFAATEPELIRSTGPELDGADRPPDPQPAQVTIDRRGPDSAGDRNAVTKSTSEE